MTDLQRARLKVQELEAALNRKSIASRDRIAALEAQVAALSAKLAAANTHINELLDQVLST